MSTASRVGRRGSVASSLIVAGGDPGLSSVSYPTFAASTTPVGLISVPMTVNAGAVTVNANGQLGEGNNSGTTTSAYFSAGVFAETMASGLYKVEVGTGTRGFATDRGIGAGFSNADGSVIVYYILCSSSTAGSIQTWVGGVRTSQSTASVFSASASDVTSLVPSLSGGVYTYTVYKNGTATALTWTDSTGVIGTPGRHPAVAFRHAYSGGQYASPGIDSLAATLI